MQAHLYITRPAVQQTYCRAGIDSKMLELVKAVTGLDIYAAADDGLNKQDGSHLTGDKPAFIAAMRG
ncbi:hypothetical protein [Stutzerimonas nitrititolerans]|uniref:hypothetical protein n=1 Tax=Stutzerimonas nitrititolerans TaxID=2482751 RepID=UPI0028A76599|nr:hypothetical protein [Stutzerimonas nitrititolerans]